MGLEKYPSLPVIGGKDCAKVSKTPSHNSSFKIGQNVEVTALHTPCHTQDSICWYMRDTSTDEKVVFTGDTKVFPGHEYTKANVKFLVTVDRGDAVKQLQKFADENKETQGKFTIADEKRYNAFMRVGDAGIQKATGETGPVEVMAKLREMKNSM